MVFFQLSFGLLKIYCVSFMSCFFCHCVSHCNIFAFFTLVVSLTSVLLFKIFLAKETQEGSLPLVYSK